MTDDERCPARSVTGLRCDLYADHYGTHKVLLDARVVAEWDDGPAERQAVAPPPPTFDELLARLEDLRHEAERAGYDVFAWCLADYGELMRRWPSVFGARRPEMAPPSPFGVR